MRNIVLAAVDYLANIKPVAKASIWLRVWRILENTMEAGGPNSIANLEIAMRNRRMC